MVVKNQKRQDILNSAGALFRDKGFHNTKMEDIAAAAGVGKGTLYEYFKNKQDILDESCVEFVDNIIDRIRYIYRMDKTFKEKLLILFKEKLKMDSGIANMSIDDILSSKNIISEKTVKTIIGKVSEMYSVISDIVDQGKEEGVVRKDIQSDIVSFMIVGTMGEYLRLKMYNKEFAVKEDVIILDLLYNGFAVKNY